MSSRFTVMVPFQSDLLFRSPVWREGSRRFRGRGACRAVWWVCLGWGLTASAQVRINEIMYHPASEDTREEYIELVNAGEEPVNVDGWRLTRGVRYTLPDRTLPAGGFLVLAADVDVFSSVYGSGLPVVGNWEGRLSNSHEEVELEDAAGARMDLVCYADEGDWAVRRRGPLDRGHRGWIWAADHDGHGMSLERISARMPVDSGQNWAAGVSAGGTPGAENSVHLANPAPVVLDLVHVPAVPTSQDSVLVRAEVMDENQAVAEVLLFRRLDGEESFAGQAMLDDGNHDDGVAGDGVYGAVIPPQPPNAVVEFYVRAQDADGIARTWPAPAWDEEGADLGQVANALYQVDDTPHTGAQPLLKIILTEIERAELQTIGSAAGAAHDSDAQMNATVITMDGTGRDVRYTVGVRNRGHGSRNRKPNNFRINFNSDRPWRGVTALNINAQYTHLQILGAVLALRSGLAGAEARPMQVRVNNVNLGNNGPQTYGGVYAAHEVIDSDWAEHWFPDDGAGNLYRAVRDIDPPNFDYRGDDWTSYTHTYFKKSNQAENDWTDLIGMLEVMGENRTEAFTLERAQAVIDVDQWLLHLAVMALFANGESGLNTGNNDDYFMYAGVRDPRFILMYYDLDQILGQNGSQSAGSSIFRSTCCPVSGDSEGSWRAMDAFLRRPEVEEAYHRVLRNLVDTTFAKISFDPTVDQVLGGFVPGAVRTNLKDWMDRRREYVESEVAPYLAARPSGPRATVRGEPRSPTHRDAARLTVGGDGVTAYRFSLDGGSYGPVLAVEDPLVLTHLASGAAHQVRVIGVGANGVWQREAEATSSAAWEVRSDWPAIRINEVLADNAGVLDHDGTTPDAIELFNEGDEPVGLSGIRLTDDPEAPGKFQFPAGSGLAAGERLVVFAGDPDGTPGWHTGFSLSRDGEGVYLFDAEGGRGLLDAVVYGLQLPDLSIGRVGEAGTFVLNEPTLGSPNAAQPVGDPFRLRINEWLAQSLTTGGDDFVELFNPDPRPVEIGGLVLTDNPIGEPAKSPIAPLSFVAGQGMRSFIADGDPEDGSDHVAFKLAAESGLIALLDPTPATIDLVAYGPQQTDRSEGRLPDGDARITGLAVPTPGAPNPSETPCAVTQVSHGLMTFTNLWRYRQTEDLAGTGWEQPAYDDAHWPVGAGLLYAEDEDLPAPKNTPLTPGRMTYYFRTSFQMPTDPVGFRLTLETVLDDGAVIYLNGSELTRVGMGDGPVNDTTWAARNVNDAVVETLDVDAPMLAEGENVVAVEVHQANPWSPDVVWGLRLRATALSTNCLGGGVVLNEVLAARRTSVGPGEPAYDFVELWNASEAPVDLGGMGLSDDPTRPDRWQFPAGTWLEPGAFLVVTCDAEVPPDATNAGFGLSADGETLLLSAFPPSGAVVVDRVSFGLQAPGFSLGREVGGDRGWIVALPTPDAPNVAAGLGSASSIRFNEWMAFPATGEDWFELYNLAPQPVAVGGLVLTDNPSDRDGPAIPERSVLGPGEARRFWADGSPHQGADHAGFRLDADGDFIGLYRPSGAQLDAVQFGPQTGGVSEGRFRDGNGPIRGFPESASPGGPNFLPIEDLVIHEVLSHSDPPWEDAVEIWNRGSGVVDVGGWLLTNDGSHLGKYVVPPGTVIPAGAFAVFYEHEFGAYGSPGAVAPFAFDSAHGDEVHLVQTGPGGEPTGYRAVARFGAAANGVSFGLHATSVSEVFVAQAAPTFGVDHPASVEDFRTGAGGANRGPRVGPVVISEIHYRPVSGYQGDTRTGIFVEVRNTVAMPVPLHDSETPSNAWRLDGGGTFVFPPGVVLPAGGSVMVVGFDPVAEPDAAAWFRTQYGLEPSAPLYGPLEGALAEGGDFLALIRPDTPQPASASDAGFVPRILVEDVRWLPVEPWPIHPPLSDMSLQRRDVAGFGNEPLHWFVAEVSPHRDNLADSDGDGLPDYWESMHRLNPAGTNGVDGAMGDKDEDGSDNYTEYRAGTDPGDDGDVMRIRSLTRSDDGWSLSFRVGAGRRYRVESNNGDLKGPWRTMVDAPRSANPADVDVLDPGPGSDPARNYRILIPEEPEP